MRFTKPFWEGIADGSVTVAYRRWKKPTVVVGRFYRTGGGRVEVVDITQCDESSITDADADRAGYKSTEDLLARLPGDATDPERNLYRVEFKVSNEPDPRAVLAANDQLTTADVEGISARLARLDRASMWGAWTLPTLKLIAERPHTRAPDLALSVGRETAPFKLDVRKLKNLGLTLSFNPGYTLSPRGEAYLEAVEKGL